MLSMQAGSPLTDYTVGVIIQVLLIGVLIAGLLIGGILFVNLGLMSKRSKDHIGGRTPSDVGILKDSNWPIEETTQRSLPAEEDEPEKPAA
jgi:hypothetical protein